MNNSESKSSVSWEASCYQLVYTSQTPSCSEMQITAQIKPLMALKLHVCYCKVLPQVFCFIPGLSMCIYSNLACFKNISIPLLCLLLKVYCVISGLFRCFVYIYSSFRDISTPLQFYFVWIYSFKKELLCYKGISGTLDWYYIVCSASNFLYYLPSSVDISHYCIHIYPIRIYHLSFNARNFHMFLFGALLFASEFHVIVI